MDITRCVDCAEAPVYQVSAGQPPAASASVAVCADQRCVDEARRWVGGATGQPVSVVALGGR